MIALVPQTVMVRGWWRRSEVGDGWQDDRGQRRHAEHCACRQEDES